MLKIYSPQPEENSGDVTLNEDDDIDDDSESENDSIEERWVPTDEDFEARVLRATENNFSLAARLIPQIYEMFQQEGSSFVGFWETSYQKRVGNSYGQGSKTQGGGGDSLGNGTSQTQMIENDREKTTRRMAKKARTTRREIGTAIEETPKPVVGEGRVLHYSHARSIKSIR
jgi:hypothetical protein